MISKANLFIGSLVGLLFIGRSGCGPFGGIVAGFACNTVCGAAYVACTGSSLAMDVALLSNPVTAPFAGWLAPLFVSGCGAGFAACMTACVGGALVAPTP